MKKILISCLFSLLLCSCSHKDTTSLIWIEGPRQEDKHAIHELVICNPPRDCEWDIWGIMDKVWTMPLLAMDNSDADIHVYEGQTVRICPKCIKDTLHLYYSSRYLNRFSRAPRGFCLKKRGEGQAVQLDVEYRFIEAPEMEDEFYLKSYPAIHDIVPSIKSVHNLPGMLTVLKRSVCISDGHPDGWYRITLDPASVDGCARIEAADPSGAYYADITLNRLIENAGGCVLPGMVLEDWPDFPTRAFMLDVARNFIPKEDIFKLIDVLARAKVNTLFLHLTDDEAWRIEIQCLPELTEFGAFHEAPEYMHDGTYKPIEALYPSQDGIVGRKKPWKGSNGYYSRRDFRDILEYADKHHIKVIPELDVPGHSRAAILAMEHRAEKTGDKSLILTDPDDSSEFMAYLGYTHNVLDVALPATYRFLGIVFDELKSIYEESGLELETINISGDEVASGCWLGSPSCRKLMERNLWTGSSELWSYFLNNVIDMLAERGIRFAAYAEVLMGTSETTLQKMRRNASYIIYWRPLGEETDNMAYEFANRGFPMLLSHSDYTYMDNVYNLNKAERGLDWSGATSENKAYSYNPLHLEGLTAKLEKPENIVGIEAMLWGDNIYTFEQDCYHLFPKVYGLLERMWNAVPEIGEAAFGHFYSTVVEHEIPYIESCSLNYRNLRKEKKTE